MITTADALEVMAVVAACHQRTAPRMDDREVATATAGVWAELINVFDFTKPELIAAVKSRAKGCPDAPEVADIIRVARVCRADQMARDLPPDESEPYWGTVSALISTIRVTPKAAPDIADYPADWDAGQRTAAYWFALRMRAQPRNSSGWEALAAQLAAEQAKRADLATARQYAVTELAGLVKEAAHWGSSNCIPVDEYVEREAARVVDAVVAAVDERYEIATVQAAVVATINALGVTLIGSGFTQITSSPIPDDEVAQILATARADR